MLRTLETLASASFDVAFIDGNHEPGHLRQELQVMAGLVRPGGLLVVDDLNWSELGEVVRGLSSEGLGTYEQVVDDGRMAVLRLTAGAPVAGGTAFR